MKRRNSKRRNDQKGTLVQELNGFKVGDIVHIDSSSYTSNNAAANPAALFRISKLIKDYSWQDWGGGTKYLQRCRVRVAWFPPYASSRAIKLTKSGDSEMIELDMCHKVDVLSLLKLRNDLDQMVSQVVHERVGDEEDEHISGCQADDSS